MSTRVSPGGLGQFPRTLGFLTALIGLAPPLAAAQTLDQSFTATPNPLFFLLNECCREVAQTFTAGRTGTLAGVSVDIEDTNPTGDFPLRVAIRTAPEGRPSSVVLSEVTLSSGTSHLSELVVFPEEIDLLAGNLYAIVVAYEPAPGPGPGLSQGVWLGATDDPYPRGSLFASRPDGVSWSRESGDLHFQTYLTLRSVPEPASWTLILAGWIGWVGWNYPNGRRATPHRRGTSRSAAVGAGVEPAGRPGGPAGGAGIGARAQAAGDPALPGVVSRHGRAAGHAAGTGPRGPRRDCGPGIGITPRAARPSWTSTPAGLYWLSSQATG